MKIFCDIDNPKEMVAYLSDNKRFNSIKCINKYTKLSSLKKIIASGFLYLNKAKDMNDLAEYQEFGKADKWKGIYYSCFTAAQEENMAMWSMYAQPWDEGVFISIPLKGFKEWIDSLQTGYAVKDKKVDEQDAFSIEPMLYRVAYESKGVLTCTGRDDRNRHFENVYQLDGLRGYVKNHIWEYERELRLRVDLNFNNKELPDSIAVPITSELINSMRIITGPRYGSQSVIETIPPKYRGEISIEASSFQNQLGWIPCDDCFFKKKHKS